MEPATRSGSLSEVRRALLTLTSGAATRRAGALAASASALGILAQDASMLLEIAACVARDATDAELARFLKTGRLPDLISLSPKQIEQVRGGCVSITASRGVPPETLVSCWLERAQRDNF